MFLYRPVVLLWLAHRDRRAKATPKGREQNLFNGIFSQSSTSLDNSDGNENFYPNPKNEDSELEHCGLCAIHCISILHYANLIIYYSLPCNIQFLSFAIMVGGTAQNFIFHYPNSFPAAR
jgi:hypothetical protein